MVTKYLYDQLTFQNCPCVYQNIPIYSLKTTVILLGPNSYIHYFNFQLKIFVLPDPTELVYCLPHFQSVFFTKVGVAHRSAFAFFLLIGTV